MKRIFLALMVAGVLFAAVYASAASIGVSGGYIQAGSDDDLTCSDQAEARVKMWNYDSGLDKITSVTFRGMDEKCVPAELYVKIYDGDTVLANGHAATATGQFDVELDPPVDPLESLQLQVVVTGGE
jgi:hypothetical protein